MKVSHVKYAAALIAVSSVTARNEEANGLRNMVGDRELEEDHRELVSSLLAVCDL